MKVNDLKVTWRHITPPSDNSVNKMSFRTKMVSDYGTYCEISRQSSQDPNTYSFIRRGFAKLSSKDTFNKWKGRNISFIRALINSPLSAEENDMLIINYFDTFETKFKKDYKSFIEILKLMASDTSLELEAIQYFYKNTAEILANKNMYIDIVKCIRSKEERTSLYKAYFDNKITV